MRPQQNRRMRGRGGGNNNQNRKGPNPLTRSYESNGPDVKIRGTAQQIAEKYATLARDAQSSGDRVMAENYLQHAEHYNRIIMAAQAQLPQQQPRDSRDEEDFDDDGEENQSSVERQVRPQQAQPQHQSQPDGTGPQPEIEGTPAEVALRQDDAGEPAPVQAEAPAQKASPRGRGRPQRRAAGNDAADAPAAAVADEPAPQQDAAAEGAEAPKPRRGRRPRIKVEQEISGDAQAPASSHGEEPVTEAAQ